MWERQENILVICLGPPVKKYNGNCKEKEEIRGSFLTAWLLESGIEDLYLKFLICTDSRVCSSFVPCYSLQLPSGLWLSWGRVV